MFLVRLVYTSSVTDYFKPNDIDVILESARAKNRASDVTGLLCFNHEYFLQCLEGSRTAVNQIYRKILNDPRHQDIIMLDYTEINERQFDQWTMGYVPGSSLTSPLNLKYSGTTAFEPYEMSGKSAQLLMEELRDTVPNQ